MNYLELHTDAFKLKLDKLLIGCDSIEETEIWDKEELGEMDVYLLNELVSIVIRCTSADGRFFEEEAEYINDVFGFEYTAEDLRDIYVECKESIDTVFEEGIEETLSTLGNINDDLMLAYRDVLLQLCKLITESDGIVSSAERVLVNRLKDKVSKF